MNTVRARAVGLLLAVLLSFGVGVYVGVGKGGSEPSTASLTADLNGLAASAKPEDVDISQFWKAWSLLDENYVPTHTSSTIPSVEERVFGAIAGLVNSYGDPYTVFLPPAEAKIFKEDISGAFGGVGMELDENKDGQILVVAPLKGSPAEAAGIRSRDLV